MKDKELVSIIVPAFNTEKYIEKSIKSIMNQTYENIEIIIIDDGSTDNTAEVCNKLAEMDNRIKVIHQENKGVVTARNMGIINANGKYISFVDSDDWLESNMIEKMVSLIKGVDLVSVGAIYERSKDEKISMIDRYNSGKYELYNGMDVIYSSMLFNKTDRSAHAISPWMWNKLFKTDLVKEIYIKLDANIKFGEDTVFVYLYLLKCKGIYISHDCLYHYCYRSNSAFNKVNIDIFLDIYKIYIILQQEFEMQSKEYDLVYQLQEWFIFRMREAINQSFGFDKRIYIPKYLTDLECLDGKKIVLFGAGNVGQDIYNQIIKLEFNIVNWIDNSYKKYQERGLCVHDPIEVLQNDFDIVFIAIENEDVMIQIKKQLIDLGIDESKIKWKKLYKVF